MMKCVICKQGETAAGKVTVTLERESTMVIIKQVPAQVCKDCGEYYLAEGETRRVMEIANKAAQNKAEVEILRYAA